MQTLQHQYLEQLVSKQVKLFLGADKQTVIKYCDLLTMLMMMIVD